MSVPKSPAVGEIHILNDTSDDRNGTRFRISKITEDRVYFQTSNGGRGRFTKGERYLPRTQWKKTRKVRWA